MIDALCVRSAAAGDAPRVAQIHWESWLATYRGVFPQQSFDEFPLAQREPLWAREAQRHTDPAQRRQLLVAERDARIAGFASVGPYRVQTLDEPGAALDGELFAIYLDPLQQRTGIGRALWGASTAWLLAAGFDAVRLWCIAGNPAEAFYVSMGARCVGRKSLDAHGTPLCENCYRAATH